MPTEVKFEEEKTAKGKIKTGMYDSKTSPTNFYFKLSPQLWLSFESYRTFKKWGLAGEIRLLGVDL